MSTRNPYVEKGIPNPYLKKVINALTGQFRIIREINKKYAKPRIKMTKWVKIALLGIRLYLIVLVIILVYKFITLVI
jgi:hypothetical protein